MLLQLGKKAKPAGAPMIFITFFLDLKPGWAVHLNLVEIFSFLFGMATGMAWLQLVCRLYVYRPGAGGRVWWSGCCCILLIFVVDDLFVHVSLVMVMVMNRLAWRLAARARSSAAAMIMFCSVLS